MADHHEMGYPINETDDLVLWRRWLVNVAIPWLILAGIVVVVFKYLF
jgi:hypothetical protein